MTSAQNSSHRYSEKFLPFLAMLVISAQLASHVLGPRVIVVNHFLLPGGIWSFPLTFFIWDIITEVYGFYRARQIIMYYVGCQLFFAFLIWVTLKFQIDPSFSGNNAFEVVLNSIPRITLSMIIAVFCGDYINCLILQKLKIYSKGSHLWFRLIGATAAGEAITSVIWVVLFYWHQPLHPDLLKLIGSQYVVKVLFEIVAVPITYAVVAILEKYELNNSIKKYLNFDPETLEFLSRNEVTYPDTKQ